MGSVCAPSADVVARDIDGELIIVPLTAAAMAEGEQDAIFTLNETGRAVWDRLDGSASLGDVAHALAAEFEAAAGEIEQDVIGLAEELLKRGMLVEAARR